MEPAAMETGQQAPVLPGQDQPWEYSLRKYLLLLATIVASITYTVGFNPPGGVWQESSNDDVQLASDPIIRDFHLAGDPIIRDTHYRRYLTFFYCNATAFIASLVVIVLILILAVRHDKEKEKKGAFWVASGVVPLRLVMVLDLLSLVGAYAAGTCRDKVSSLYSAALVAAIFIYIVILKLLDWWFPDSNSVSTFEFSREKMKAEERFCKVLMLLATFAVSITYVAGLNMPGGFWDSTEGSQRPDNVILKDHHSLRLTVFLLCNTTAFVASLLTTMLLIINGRKLLEKTARSIELYACIIVALVSLVTAYAGGSCRKTNNTTVYVVSLVGVILVLILLLEYFYTPCSSSEQQTDENQQTGDNDRCSDREALDKTRSLVLLLATLAATVTYSAGLNPPGGLWQDNSDRHMAGNPILLTIDARRYNVFFYCNSVSFVASLVAIILVQKELPVKHHVLEAAMILDLFGLIGAYAAGSCRDVMHSIYAAAMAIAVLGYVVIHVAFFDHKKNKDEIEVEDRLLEKRRKRLLLFAILAATITYQAGLTPPGGFLLQDDKLEHHVGDPVLYSNHPHRYKAFSYKHEHHAGDPVLYSNNPHRYKAFFYCNSVSFMLSISLIILLVNPNLYKPAIRSNALSVCTAVGLFCLMGAYAAGSTQDIKTSIYIFVLVALVLLVAAGLQVVFLVRERYRNDNPVATRSIEQDGEERKIEEEERKKKEEEKKEDEEEKKKHAFVLVALVLLVAAGLRVVFLVRERYRNANRVATRSIEQDGEERKKEEEERKKKEEERRKKEEEKKEDEEEKKKHASRKYLMLLGILVASVAYQAGLTPPGGTWQSSNDGHGAGNPVMQDEMRGRYLFFFYSNSVSFVASIVVIIMLLPHWLPKKKKEGCEEWSLRVMNKMIILDLAALLWAYAAGSSRGWKTSMYVVALIFAVLGYFAIHMAISLCSDHCHRRRRQRSLRRSGRQSSQRIHPL